MRKDVHGSNAPACSLADRRAVKLSTLEAGVDKATYHTVLTRTGCSSARLERTVRDREAGSSNLPTPTNTPDQTHGFPVSSVSGLLQKT